MSCRASLREGKECSGNGVCQQGKLGQQWASEFSVRKCFCLPGCGWHSCAMCLCSGQVWFGKQVFRSRESLCLGCKNNMEINQGADVVCPASCGSHGECQDGECFRQHCIHSRDAKFLKKQYELEDYFPLKFPTSYVFCAFFCCLFNLFLALLVCVQVPM